MAERNITQPGYAGLSSALNTDATNLANNPYQVPDSVVNQLSQYAAENNIGEGTGAASGFSQSGLLQSLGVNALQYGTQNLQSATQALSALSGTAPNVSPVSPLSFLLTPSQALQTQTTNATNNQQINQQANNAATAAGNYNSTNLFDSLSGQVSPLTSAVGAYLQGSSGGTDPANPGGYTPVGAPLAGGLAKTCWLAREVFGATNPKWVLFRMWMLTKAPVWLCQFYIRHGQKMAAFVKRHPWLKPPIRAWMEARICPS